ncbi:MAG TPA: transglutaminase-like domain-containing protein [Planctomycetota bacterium]|nr:transglutaminase-like domain-containing protein [Planctomycetota bacterium]
MRLELRDLPAGGRASLDAKLAVARELVDQGKLDPHFREIVSGALREIPERDADGEIAALLDFVRSRVRFQRDPAGVELFADPLATLATGAGDCDDQAILLAAALECAGYATRFEVGGESSSGPFSHIWLSVLNPRRGWVSLDPSRREAPVGWRPRAFPSVLSESGLGRTVPMYASSNAYLTADGAREMRSGVREPSHYRARASVLGDFDLEAILNSDVVKGLAKTGISAAQAALNKKLGLVPSSGSAAAPAAKAPASSLPSWVKPVAIGGAGLLAAMLLMRGRR